MRFEFMTSNRILFGEGTLEEIQSLASNYGGNTLIVCGSGSVPLAPLMTHLEKARINIEVFRIHHEPDVPTIQSGIEKAKSNRCSFVIGYGGGSTIDAAKAIAAMLTNPGALMDYLEVIGEGGKIPNQPAPMVAIPTTAGTGTEVTRNAVITSPEYHVKVSMRSPMMIPMVAIVDPELTYSMPPSVTASTGMDALTQVIEAYVSIKANPMTDAIAREGIICGARSLKDAYEDGGNKTARSDMALTSLFGGLALANSGLGAVHGFAGPIGGMFNAPHGEVCASLLPYVIKYNVLALEEKIDSGETKKKYQEIAGFLTGNPNASIQDGVKWVVDLAEGLNIPGLRQIGISKSDFDVIIEKSRVSSSMQKNPVILTEKSLRAILDEAF